MDMITLGWGSTMIKYIRFHIEIYSDVKPLLIVHTVSDTAVLQCDKSNIIKR